MFSEGIKKIWSEDAKFQTDVIKAILSDIRKIEDENLIDALFDKLKENGAFYVPDDEYMIRYFGNTITDSRYGVYYADYICKYNLRLVLPMIFFDGTINGFIGYTNVNDIDPEDGSFIKYLYPPKITVDKRRFLFITPEEYKKAYREQYICITDGLFDQMSLTAHDINACSLCGSNLTLFHKLYLSTIKHIIVLADNDPAGRKLYNSIKKSFPTSVEIIQTLTWDIDDFMKNTKNILRLKETLTQMEKEGFCVNHVIK
jgi:5S rRNA maturation endonuclease (ribonuclease M5)